MSIFIGDTAPRKIFVGGSEVASVWTGDTKVRPVIHLATQGPCPDGYHVPLSSEMSQVTTIIKTTFSLPKTSATAATYLKMPMSGYRSYSYAGVVNKGRAGKYLLSDAYNNLARALQIVSSGIDVSTMERAAGCNVRPFKDTPEIPTSSWTTLYDGSSIATNAGIFHDSSNGQISISGDGINRITISDKNLGATIVYNNGDTLSNSNCGYFYQRGNNYGFPASGNVSTSRTKVDTRSYGPGNYYNNNTFIIDSSSPYDWSDPQNDNLRGGEDGNVPV